MSCAALVAACGAERVADAAPSVTVAAGPDTTAQPSEVTRVDPSAPVAPAPSAAPDEPDGSTEVTAPAEPVGPITIAFGGDTHTEGRAAKVGTEGLGPIADTFRAADLGIVNLETAIVTSSGVQAAPKQYTFATSPQTLDVLAADGVDVVSMANNHGLDFGQQGLEDSLAAIEASQGSAVVGIGADLDQALAPFVADVAGRRVGVLAATDVLDSFALDTWPATSERGGMASTKGDAEEGVLEAVRRLDAEVDVAVVLVHWGVERTVCPTQRQQELGAALLEAGADVVVGSHAHVVQPVSTVDGRTVAYGLGNFGWYTERAPSNRTGVLSVTIAPDGSQSTAWQPATISGGQPRPDGAVTPVPDLSAAGCSAG